MGEGAINLVGVMKYNRTVILSEGRTQLILISGLCCYADKNF